MVMAVGNSVTGDSRVEKMAVTAANSGFDVTIVGVKHRTTHTFGAYRNVPIYRPTPDWTDYNNFLKAKKESFSVTQESIEAITKSIDSKTRATTRRLQNFADGVGEISKVIAPMHLDRYKTPNIDWMTAIVGKVGRLRHRAVQPWANIKSGKSWLYSAQPGAWRELWKQIEGFEALFLNAFRELKPDIIHVHDRHPMSAAYIYQSEQKALGIDLNWIYDAHEYLPGQRFSGPIQHRIGWLAMEREMIQKASAVITVSDELAENLERRHSLLQRPWVVSNAPTSTGTSRLLSGRTDLRSELALDSSTPLMVYVGKLAERRGIYTAVDALPQLEGVHLAYLASKDPGPRDELRKRALAHGVEDRLHILDYVPSSLVPSYISTATIGLSPLYATPAHELALATKIREYLQAQLPMVVSDLKVQGAFVRSTGIGVAHAPGDTQSFAKAVRAALRDIADLRSNISPDLLREHSWERQEEVLEVVWKSFLPHSVEKQTIQKSESNLSSVQAAPTLSQRTQAIADAATRLGLRAILKRPDGFLYRVEGDVWQMVAIAEGDLRSQLSVWSKIVSEPGLFILESFEPPLPMSIISPEGMVPMFQDSGVSVLYDAPEGILKDPNDVLEVEPRSFWADISSESVQRTSIRRRRLRKLLEAWKPILTSAEPGFGNTESNRHWLPLILPVEKSSSDSYNQSTEAAISDGLRVGISTANRSKSELEAIRLAINSIHGYSMFDPFDQLGEIDIAIGSLTSATYSEDDLRFMAAGVPVIGNVSPAVRLSIEREVPIIQSDLDSLHYELQRVAGEPQLLSQAARNGLDFVSTFHSWEAFDSALSGIVLHS
ncbi:glycosyltransferase family 4 protein [Brevibacterium sp. XM4083]|uniref:glycosyltransferase family 4 protein n=1 Tax=Brevibacterium sp. XM4083 TaxID=2583238 RepID=UPI001129D7FB|nr:glycosyltransferase family 4 protein [Brevibacterium sp. XM4083]MCM1012853.1 glycosyltransferase family 4 protein [Brevibacterium sp. XM4083]